MKQEKILRENNFELEKKEIEQQYIKQIEHFKFALEKVNNFFFS